MLLLLWLGWSAQALIAALMAHKLCRLIRRDNRQRYEAKYQYAPRVALIVPFKGEEPGLAEHLDRLCSQRYDDAIFLFIVESEQDPAVPVLRAAMERHDPRQVTLLVAGESPDTRGQKVHNQLCAMEHLQASDHGETIWVFADSDAAVGEHWLSELVMPLCREPIGVTTGYRWLVPQADATGRVPLAARLASIVNASAVGFMVRERFALAWGGSMAIRRELALELDYPGLLENSLSDDYMMSHMIHQSGKRIYFVPRCLVASPCDLNWQGLCDFARRQYLITKVYMPWLYYGALMLPTLYVAGLLTAITVLLLADGPMRIAAAVALVWVIIMDLWRSRRRATLIGRALGEDVLQRMKSTLLLDRLATPMWMALHGGLMFTAFFGRTITWRGKTYRMNGRTATQRLR